MSAKSEGFPHELSSNGRRGPDGNPRWLIVEVRIRMPIENPSSGTLRNLHAELGIVFFLYIRQVGFHADVINRRDSPKVIRLIRKKDWDWRDISRLSSEVKD